MLGKNQGFTLLELLIAAAIISVLMMFASQSFRQTGSDIRTQNAKAKANAVAMAARMFYEDHPGVSFSTSEWTDTAPTKKLTLQSDDSSDSDCILNQPITWQMLVNCGYLENRQYMDKDFNYMFDANGRVCIQAKSGGRIMVNADTDQYCTSGDSGAGDF